jgi:hypothetical protein
MFLEKLPDRVAIQRGRNLTFDLESVCSIGKFREALVEVCQRDSQFGQFGCGIVHCRRDWIIKYLDHLRAVIGLSSGKNEQDDNDTRRSQRQKAGQCTTPVDFGGLLDLRVV